MPDLVSLGVIEDDLQKGVSILGNTETPIKNLIREETVESTEVRTAIKPLDQADSNNARPYGADAPAEDDDNVDFITNYVQEAVRVVKRTSAEENSKHRVDKFKLAQRMVDKQLQLNRDIEASIISDNAPAKGGEGATAYSGGLGHFISTNVNSTYSKNLGVGETESGFEEFKDLLSDIFDEGGKPKTLFAGAIQMNAITAWEGRSKSSVMGMADASKVVDMVKIVHTQFGVMAIHFHPMLPVNKVLMLDKNKLALGFLQKPKWEDLAKTGTSKRKMISTQFTLIVENEKAHGMFNALSATDAA